MSLNVAKVLRAAGFVLAGVLLLGVPAARSQERWTCPGNQQQCYSKWKLHDSGKYWLTVYQYKTAPGAREHSYHYVIYYPGENWMYYFNPQKDFYWCRALVNRKEGEKKIWIVLADEEKQKRLNDVPGKAWNKEHEQPFIPGTNGPTRMDVPPELPAEAKKKK